MFDHESELIPYPGLRSFKKEEFDIYFGRDDIIDNMMVILENTNFLCISGPSGSGKSSLARTGLMTHLESGFLKGESSNWLFVDLRPGDEPLNRLYESLSAVLDNAQSVDFSNETSETYAGEYATLFRNHVENKSHNLTEALAAIEGGSDRPILILIDQFEELFRFAQRDRSAAVSFVEVLLKTAAAKKNVYITITIRTDQLENCGRYAGLAQFINKSQFLIPTLDRFQIQEAIEAPINMFGGKIERNFTVWLLNSIETEDDKLPLLQHTLKLLYEKKKYDDPLTIGFTDYTAEFGPVDNNLVNNQSRSNSLRQSFSKKLDEIFESLPSHLKEIVPRFFCALTSTDTDKKDIRRPTRVNELAGITGLSVHDIYTLIKAFNDNGETYLYVHSEDFEDGYAVVDVTHECILRLWRRLQVEWNRDEGEASENIKFLEGMTRNQLENRSARPIRALFFETNFLTGLTLRKYRDWINDFKPNSKWADRYLQKSRSRCCVRSSSYRSVFAKTEDAQIKSQTVNMVRT